MQKTFDEVVLFARTGLNPRQNFKLGQGNNYYITIKNIKNNSLVIDDNTDVVDDEAIKLIHKRSQIKKGDILFASIGRMGDMYIIEEEPMAWDINESVFAFTLDRSIVRQKYFYYIFRVKSTLDYLASNSSGSTFKSIKMNQLKKMMFEIPTLEEQDQIVAVLDKVCNVIEMRKQELDLLDELIKARFVEMFGDPTDVSLERVSLAEYVKNTKYGTSQPPQFDLEGCYKFIRATNIKNGHIVEKDMLRISKDEADKISKCKLNGGELIIVRSGANTGDTCVITDDYVGQYAGYDIIISLKTNLINPIYLNELINIPRYMRTVVKPLTARSAQPHLNTQQVQSLPIIVANIERQNQFAEFVKQVDKSKFIHINIIFGRRV